MPYTHQTIVMLEIEPRNPDATSCIEAEIHIDVEFTEDEILSSTLIVAYDNDSGEEISLTPKELSIAKADAEKQVDSKHAELLAEYRTAKAEARFDALRDR